MLVLYMVNYRLKCGTAAAAGAHIRLNLAQWILPTTKKHFKLVSLSSHCRQTEYEEVLKGKEKSLKLLFTQKRELNKTLDEHSETMTKMADHIRQVDIII